MDTAPIRRWIFPLLPMCIMNVVIGSYILISVPAGESEGKYIGFGVLESRDCCLWAQYIAKRFGTDQKIILAGLSMGASTVLMATAHHEKKLIPISISTEKTMEVCMELPENVTGIVADSAFSSPYDIIKKRIHTMFHARGI